MAVEDGRCHICRRIPLFEDPLYTLTTCVRCEDLDEIEEQQPWWVFWRRWF
jgi:hypothetical protein